MTRSEGAVRWDEAAFEGALERAKDGCLDAQRVRLESDQLERLLDALPEDPAGRLLQHADLTGAVIRGDADFSQAIFQSGADFSDAVFHGNAHFSETAFKGDADFEGAMFGGDADFQGAVFEGDADFGGAAFESDANFRATAFERDADLRGTVISGDSDFMKTVFGGDAFFLGTTFRGDALFLEAAFTGRAFFLGAAFNAKADFVEAKFRGTAWFDGATFDKDAGFGAASFEQTRGFGRVQVAGGLWLNQAVFAEAVTVELSARLASLDQAEFRAGADLLVESADVSLEDADFAGPSLLTAAESASRVVSVRRAKVANLTLSGADLRACRFAGAHGLDGLRLEGTRFAQPPADRWRLPRWTRRQTVAEEHAWRARQRNGRGWDRPDVQAPDRLGSESEQPEPEPPEPEQIAGIYRALRKGREDNKDEPGAADFYYGEMEMRRHAARARRRIAWLPGTEEAVLGLYWLVSGYGLRASRALVALAITIAVGAVLLSLSGFDAGQHPDDGTVLFAAESSISLLRAPETENLTAFGHVVQIVLRLAGPLFFGLALLSLRGRVKR